MTDASMGRIGARAAIWALAAALLPGGWAGAQDHQHHQEHMAMPESGIRAELIGEVEMLESRFVGLTEAMDAHLDWRPGEGVRSGREVMGHIAAANFMIPAMIGIDPPSRYRGDEGRAALQALQQADRDQIVAEMRHSFMHARHAIARIPDAELEDPVQLFGRDMTKRAALVLIVGHMHQHLGQAIAYARTNGVRPPWSGD